MQEKKLYVGLSVVVVSTLDDVITTSDGMVFDDAVQSPWTEEILDR